MQDHGRTPSARDNNFGAIRLFLAALVVLAHAPEVLDGDRSRELLTRFFGTLSFGDVAVDGFFLVSGYLVSKSYLSSTSGWAYLSKRVLRIYPGFIAAFLLCVLLVAPVGGGDLWSLSPLRMLRVLWFGLPEVPGAFAELPNPGLNKAMWTIQYEFRCYLLVIVLGFLGVLRRPPWFACFLVLMFGLFALRGYIPIGTGIERITGGFSANLRLGFIFCCGIGFTLAGDRIRYTGGGACLAGICLFPCMFSPAVVEPALAVFGGYIVFWYALKVRNNRVSRFIDRSDASYGLYLYAWPIQSLIFIYFPWLSPWPAAAVALVVAACLGFLSWHIVERPALKLKRRRSFASWQTMPLES